MKVQKPIQSVISVKVMLAVSVIITLLFNTINFPSQYYSDISHFLAFTFIFIVPNIFIAILSNAVSGLFLKIFPKESDLYKRLIIVIIISLLIGGLSLYALFKFYDAQPWFQYRFSEIAFLWNFIAIAILDIFRTFLIEGIRNFNEWKQNAKETEKLDASYQQSRLQALKSQVNPHFLFNSLNSLSSLIQEDEEKAETFLNEMSKVYRYMLRTDDEPLVTLETELAFIKSYHHLLTARYGDGLQLRVNIAEKESQKLIAPHSLQVIIENAFTQNIVSKASPLHISVSVDGNGKLIVQNNVQPKTVTDVLDFEAGLDNLVKKYELLGAAMIVDDTENECRTIKIPLLEKEEASV